MVVDNTKSYNVKNAISSKETEKKEDIEMKNITRRKDGRYQGSFLYNKKRHFVYDRNKKLCYKKLIELKKNITQAEKPKLRIKSRQNFYDFANVWYEKFKKSSLKPKSQTMYKNCIKNHLSVIKEDFKDLTTLKLQTYLNKMGNTRTKEIAFNTIKQIFKKAKELELIEKNPAEYLIKGKIKKGKRVGLTIEEQRLLLQNLNYQEDKFSKLILFYLLTGARRNEALNLPKSNIKKEYIFIKGTKTDNAQRYVKISNKFYNILNNETTETLFNYDNKYIEKKFRKFCNEINLKVTIHQLRHTFSSNLYYLGATDKERQTYLGHASSVITNDIYTHLDPNITKEDILNLYIDLYPKF